ncbi:hypothetical protein I4U23_022364 [Adineta vaga]|nr:hypothetical protein I4U23_022364 [Adineta vaga]
MTAEHLKSIFEFSYPEKDRINGYCTSCKKDYKDQKGIYSNFVKHLKRKHIRDYERLFPFEGEVILEETNGVDDDQAATVDLPNSKAKQKQIITSITKNLIIKCNLPLNIVEHVGFRDFLKECIFKCELISSKRIKRVIIPSFTNNVLDKIHETLSNVSDLTLTIDGWVKSPHTGDNIRQFTEEVLDRFNIEDKVFKIITDNAAAMIKAYKFGLFVDELDDTSFDRNQLVHHISETLDDDDDDDDDGKQCLILQKG